MALDMICTDAPVPPLESKSVKGWIIPDHLSLDVATSPLVSLRSFHYLYALRSLR